MSQGQCVAGCGGAPVGPGRGIAEAAGDMMFIGVNVDVQKGPALMVRPSCDRRGGRPCQCPR